MARYQYKVVPLPDRCHQSDPVRARLESELSALAAEGWESVRPEHKTGQPGAVLSRCNMTGEMLLFRRTPMTETRADRKADPNSAVR